MQYLDITSHCPSLNLALEECLFTRLYPGHEGYFLLWQNSPSIIIGRYQVAAEVINSGFAAQTEIPVIRRITGGGAVYHDLGNLNFSFIQNAAPGEKVGFRHYLEPICGALRELDIPATVSGRNDLEALGKKISGSSQCTHAGKTLLHGTLLFNVDLEQMALALRVNEDKFRSKGIASLRARVANLTELAKSSFSLGTLKNALVEHCAASVGELDSDILIAAKSLEKAKYQSWDWNYGKSPQCDIEKRRRFPWGEIAIHLWTKGGIVRHCRVSGDFFSSGVIEELSASLEQIPFAQADFSKALAKIDWSRLFSGCEPETMRKFFTEDLFA